MRHVAFLRGMNVGGHRLTNEELCAHLAALGLRDVWAFQASGNVVFDAGRRGDVARHVETGLRAALGYEVPTFLRSEDEVVEVASRVTFDPDARAGRGKEQVLFLAEVPFPSRPPAAQQQRQQQQTSQTQRINKQRQEFGEKEEHTPPRVNRRAATQTGHRRFLSLRPHCSRCPQRQKLVLSRPLRCLAILSKYRDSVSAATVLLCAAFGSALSQNQSKTWYD